VFSCCRICSLAVECVATRCTRTLECLQRLRPAARSALDAWVEGAGRGKGLLEAFSSSKDSSMQDSSKDSSSQDSSSQDRLLEADLALSSLRIDLIYLNPKP